MFVVDFDGQVAPYTDVTPVVGPMIVQTAQSLLAPSGTVGWQSQPASVFNFDPMAVRRAVYDEKAWAAVIINANATALLQDAVNNGNSSYDPMGVAQVVYVEARDENTLDNYVVPQLQQFQTEVMTSFGRMWANQVLSRASTDPSILTNIPSLLSAILLYNKIQRLSPKEKRRFAFRRLGFFYVDARRIQDLISSFRFSTAAAYSIHSLEIHGGTKCHDTLFGPWTILVLLGRNDLLRSP